MKRIAFMLAAIAALPVFAHADGGIVIARKETKDFITTVFASPVPLHAGPADIGILVQDPQTKEPILDAAVDVTWTPPAQPKAEWLPPCCSMKTGGGWQRATQAYSKNKLLSSVFIPIKAEGSSQLSVRVSRGDATEEFDVPVEVLPPVSPAHAYWPLLAFPPVAIGLFALNRRIVRRDPA